jgi:stringent starvation protein B
MASEPPKAHVVDRSPWAWLRDIARWFRGTRPEEQAASIEKRDTVETWLEHGPIVIDLDPGWRGVVVPPSFATAPSMTLRFGRALSPPITDLELDDFAISGTLLFTGRGFHVTIPWPAILAVRRENTTDHVRWRNGVRVAPTPSGHQQLPSAPPREKAALVDAMLAVSPVIIELDPRRPGVLVPTAHREASSLALRIGHELTPPIPDLRIDDTRIACTLQFGGTSFSVVLPWSAIYAARFEDKSASTVWLDDVPAELREPERGN